MRDISPLELPIQRAIREVSGISPTIYVGAVGTFHGDPLLHDGLNVQATGRITCIKEGPNYAVIAIKDDRGVTMLLKR